VAAAAIVVLAGAAAPPAGAARCASCPVVKDLAPAAKVAVRFAVRPGRRAVTVARLDANALTLRAQRRGLILRRGGRRVVRAAVRRGRWTSVRLSLDAARGVVRLGTGSRRRSVRLRGLRSERRVVVGGARVRRVAISGVAPRPVGDTAAPAPARKPAFTPAAPARKPAPAPPRPPAVAAPAPTPPPSSAEDLSGRLFGANSFWNRRLGDDAPVDPRSDAYVAELRRQLKVASPWINTTQYSTPVYRVPAGQPTERVVLDTNLWALQREWEAVPIPPGARPAAGSDKHLVIHQPSTDTLWEFWHLERRDGTWHARWGGKMTGVSANPGYFTGAQSSWGATATSLPLAGGLMTIDEVRRGSIDHALALAIPHPKAREFSWPAQRTDGSNYAADAIPEGARFRLDPTLDLDSLRLPRLVRLMAEAAQRYGLVVRDKAGAVVFYGEDSTPTGSDPWRGSAGFFEGQYPNRLLERFPWDRLQALQTEMACCWKR
jgi:hypothetical protein